MPVSTSVHITCALRHIILQQPCSILDVGCGFGLWGFLSRTYLDVFNGRVQPEEWRVRIDGIEYFEPYIQAHQKALYNKIIIGDIRDLSSQVEEYDLIICGDVIEHLEKEDGQRVLDQLYEKAKGALLVNIPLGEEGWDHPITYGNPAELHRSQWQLDDFKRFPCEYQSFTLPNGEYGVFLCPKKGMEEDRIAGLLLTAYDRGQAGDLGRAVHYARKAVDLAPAHPEAVSLLSGLLLQEGNTGEAVQVLQNALTIDARLDRVRLNLCRILHALGRKQEARKELQALFSFDDLSADLKASLNSLAQQMV